jgi:hypothetical protein
VCGVEKRERVEEFVWDCLCQTGQGLVGSFVVRWVVCVCISLDQGVG